MKPSEALRIARDKVASGYEYYICTILLRLSTPGADKAKARIKDLLEPHNTYGAWLEHHHPEQFKKYTLTPGAPIAARLCWVDDMIKYWEAKRE